MTEKRIQIGYSKAHREPLFGYFSEKEKEGKVKVKEDEEENVEIKPSKLSK